MTRCCNEDLPRMSPATDSSSFGATRWTLVLRAQGGGEAARLALSELCEAYYRPVLRFLCREGRTQDEARDLAHSFFARVLERGDLRADPKRGRFRSYLLGALKHFLADERKAANRQKRGSGVGPDSLDERSEVEGMAEPPDPRSEAGDALFDREWALALMERSMNRVHGEFVAAGKVSQFDLLKPWLVGDAGGLKQSEAAAALGWSETAAKVAIHRLRKRFRQTVREEIAQTLTAAGDIDEELRYLVQTLAAERGA